MSSLHTPTTPAGPWPLALGMLAASSATLMGVFIGCEPPTILYRSLVSAAIVTMVASIIRCLWRFLEADRQQQQT